MKGDIHSFHMRYGSLLSTKRLQRNSFWLPLTEFPLVCTEIGKKAWLFAKLQPGRARKRINAT